MTPRYVVRSLTLQPDGSIALEYTDIFSDLRANGLVQNHVLYVPADTDYDEELDAVHDAIQALLRDALEDLTLMEPVDPRPQASQLPLDDDEEDESTSVERTPS